MSFGALSANVKEALGRAATDDGHLDHDRRRRHDAGRAASRPRRSSTSACRRATASTPTTCARPTRSRSSSARAPSPAAAACCSGRRSARASPRCGRCPKGIDQRSACRHPDWTGPDDLTIKIEELREITDWQVPIYVKIGATRVREDVKLAVKAGADVVVIDGMQGGTAATQQVFIEHAGIPTLAAVRAGGRGARRDGRVRRGAAHHLRRHPHRRRRRQGAGAGRRRRRDRPGRADRARLQQPTATSTGRPDSRRRPTITTSSARRRASAITATPASARSASRRRTRSSNSGCSLKKVRGA